ncbi:hypothetical protein IQ07DRAFT_199733 [Pyrenochaeta sp. DS3sAY3a]|nr:hypothetical protein IQ07DRAFT_199733 [Pyrenochaeta sp. DS3sAY3a]
MCLCYLFCFWGAMTFFNVSLLLFFIHGHVYPCTSERTIRAGLLPFLLEFGVHIYSCLYLSRCLETPHHHGNDHAQETRLWIFSSHKSHYWAFWARSRTLSVLQLALLGHYVAWRFVCLSVLFSYSLHQVFKFARTGIRQGDTDFCAPAGGLSEGVRIHTCYDSGYFLHVRLPPRLFCIGCVHTYMCAKCICSPGLISAHAPNPLSTL